LLGHLEGSQFLVGGLSEEAGGEVTFAAGPQRQQCNPKIRVQVTTGTVAEELTPAILEQLLSRWSDFVVGAAAFWSS